MDWRLAGDAGQLRLIPVAPRDPSGVWAWARAQGLNVPGRVRIAAAVLAGHESARQMF